MSETFLLPGLMPLEDFRKQMKRCPRTMKRWEAQGKLVIHALGNERFVDLEKTAARVRGEGRRRGRK
jgi:hypothetical protein